MEYKNKHFKKFEIENENHLNGSTDKNEDEEKNINKKIEELRRHKIKKNEQN